MVKCNNCFRIDSVNHLLRRVKFQNKTERIARKNDESNLKLSSTRNYSCSNACSLLGKPQGTTNEQNTSNFVFNIPRPCFGLS